MDSPLKSPLRAYKNRTTLVSEVTITPTLSDKSNLDAYMPPDHKRKYHQDVTGNLINGPDEPCAKKMSKVTRARSALAISLSQSSLADTQDQLVSQREKITLSELLMRCPWMLSLNDMFRQKF